MNVIMDLMELAVLFIKFAAGIMNAIAGFIEFMTLDFIKFVAGIMNANAGLKTLKSLVILCMTVIIVDIIIRKQTKETQAPRNHATWISPNIKKYRPHGSRTGTEQNIDDKIGEIARVVKITVYHGEAVNALTMHLERFDGERPSYHFGRNGGVQEEISFEPDEYITCVRGFIGPMRGTDCVRSIEIKTNHKVYGPYGKEVHKYEAYKFEVDGGQIIGFHGYYDEFIHAVGVYAKDDENLRKQLEEESRLHQETKKNYCKVLNENKAFKESIKEWEMYCSSYPMLKFTWFKPSELPTFDPEQDRLGGGAFGDVYKAKFNGTTVAIKMPKQDWVGAREFNQEVDILGRIRHPHLITLVGACPMRHVLVYEYLPHGSLSDRLFQAEDQIALSWKERIKIATDICSVLVFLHNIKPNPIAHGDLKPGNILFDSNYKCKLGDFGISRFLKNTDDTETPNHETQVANGTPPYKDPEFEKTHKLTPQSDVFAFGIILLQLVTGKYAENLRNTVLSEIGSLKEFIEKDPSLQREILEKFSNANYLVGCPTNEAVKMICLGIQCSDPNRKNRPDLKEEVLNEIVNGFGSHDN